MPFARINEMVFTKCWVWDMDKYDHLVIMHGVSRGMMNLSMVFKGRMASQAPLQHFVPPKYIQDLSGLKVLPNAGLRKAAYNLLGVHANGISKGPCSMAHWWAPTPGLADIN
ncbi:hypothetical protein VNO77_18537 [Canavalia gladiata]|uniref:Uncharacterized protein n=1 Tax=Canavalia gladiata TaxID=3824 RepID=A0AAN9LKX9_CANGL